LNDRLFVLGAVVVDLAGVVDDVAAHGAGTVLSGSNTSPVPIHQVPDRTAKKRSFGWKCGRLMLPGNHFTRTTYGPGLLGSPKSTADSFVPAAFLTHLISDGVLKSTAVRSMSALRSPTARQSPARA